MLKYVILRDYSKAVVTLLWCIDTFGQRKLVFSSIELYPNECAVPETTSEQTIRVKITKENRPRLFFRCITMDAEDALSLYEECMQKHSFPMSWKDDNCKDATINQINATTLLTSPAWPSFSLGKQDDNELCPFLPERWGVCRMSHLLTSNPDPLLVKILEFEEPVNWIEDRLLWNLNEYPELIGSMHLILPNPVYRYMEERLLPGNEGAPDKVRVHLALREKQTVSAGMKLITAERSYFGVLNIQFTDVASRYITVELAGRAERFAAAFYSPTHGILDYTDFAPFLRYIHIDIGIKDAVRIVNVPGTDETYTIPLVSHDKPIIIGDKEEPHIPEIELGKRIGYHVRQREAVKESAKLGQKLFYEENKKEAQEFIRNLIQQAKDKVIIVDPYFSTLDFYRYICAVTSPKVCVTILTSSLVLKEKSNLGDNSLEKGEELLQQINTYGEKLTDGIINVFVMTGDQPLFHDRFLVTDKDVWFSGNSLNHLGERASVLLRLPEPTDVLRLIDSTLTNTDRVKSLETWVTERNEAKQAK